MMKTVRVTSVKYLRDYRIALMFSDGTRAEMDFREKIVGRGGVFTPLENTVVFKQMVVDPDVGSIVFPDEIDFCPDTLYEGAMALTRI